MNTFPCKQFGSQTEAFGQILFWFVNSTSDDQHNMAIFPIQTQNMTIVSKIEEHTPVLAIKSGT